MENTATVTKNETAAVNEHIFSDEMISKILDAEAEMEHTSNKWVTLEELKEEMAKI